MVLRFLDLLLFFRPPSPAQAEWKKKIKKKFTDPNTLISDSDNGSTFYNILPKERRRRAHIFP